MYFSANWKLRCGSSAAVSRARDPAGVRVVVPRHADLRVGVAEVHVVEDVDRLDPELDLVVPDDVEPLEERRVGAPVTGPPERILRQVAERALRRATERAVGIANRRRVEPLVSSLRAVRIADQVRPIRSGVPILAGVAIADVIRNAALNDRVLVELPAAKESRCLSGTATPTASIP